jgi:hypothetical protein
MTSDLVHDLAYDPFVNNIHEAAHPISPAERVAMGKRSLS